MGNIPSPGGVEGQGEGGFLKANYSEGNPQGTSNQKGRASCQSSLSVIPNREISYNALTGKRFLPLVEMAYSRHFHTFAGGWRGGLE